MGSFLRKARIFVFSVYISVVYLVAVF